MYFLFCNFLSKRCKGTIKYSYKYLQKAHIFALQSLESVVCGFRWYSWAWRNKRFPWICPIYHEIQNTGADSWASRPMIFWRLDNCPEPYSAKLGWWLLIRVQYSWRLSRPETGDPARLPAQVAGSNEVKKHTARKVFFFVPARRVQRTNQGKEGPLSFVLFESLFTSVSTVSWGHPSLVSLATTCQALILGL